jgi:hypothetical protein
MQAQISGVLKRNPFISRRGDEPLGLQDAIDAGFGDEGLLGVGEGDGNLARREFRPIECPLDELVADLLGDAVPDALWPRLAVYQGVETAGCVAIKPGVERRPGNADLVERAPNR